MFIKIKVFSKSKKQVVNKISDKKFEVFVKSDSKQNLANYESLKLISSFFKIPEKNVRIISGHHRPNKLIEIRD